MRHLKNDMDSFPKEKQIHGPREWIYGYQGRRVRGGIELEVWDWHVHTAIVYEYVKMDIYQYG